MRKTNLIQRLTAPTGYLNPFSFGGGLPFGGLPRPVAETFKDTFDFDYMGSAEFELGALPTALHHLFNSKPISGQLSSAHGPVYYICPQAIESEVKDVIGKLLTNEDIFSLQDPCKLASEIQKPDSERRYLGWIELDNGFFFFIDQKMYEETKELLALLM